MSPKAFAIAVASLGGVLFISLVSLIVSMGLSTPATGKFKTAFSLEDDRGNPVDQSIFKGHPALVYFGYTHCPEVCPTTLYEVADWLQALGDQGKDLKTYFFTVDPERDTPQIMHDYVTAFSDRITGITGASSEMQKVIDGWSIHARKVPAEGGDYHMDHSASLFLVGPDGRLKGMIEYNTPREEALSEIRDVLLKRL